MKRFLIFMYCSFLFRFCLAQVSYKENAGVFTGPFKEPLSSSIENIKSNNPLWSISLESLPNEADEALFNLQSLKEQKNDLKRKAAFNHSQSNFKNKTRSAPVIGTNFRGQDLKSFTPTDNTIAVSKGGKIVSCINQGIAYYDTSGAAIMAGVNWNDFLNDSTLTGTKFDPRTIYDSIHDRFIVVLLHGFSSSTSKVLVYFSKTNDPLAGWWAYKLSGNPYNDTSWTDYPTIGINGDELFINGNRFANAPTYAWKETYIYQIGLAEGYSGNTLNYGLWHQLSAPDGTPGITVYPASDGLGRSMNKQMYFVQLLPDSGSNVYVYRIDSLHSSGLATITSSQFPIPHYEVCADAYEKDPNSGLVDSLSTGSSWVQNAFYLNKTIHFTFDADMGNGWCGLYYGRVYLDSNFAVVSSHGEAGTDFCYPAVASLGYDTLDKSVAIAYVRSDTNTLPEVGVISIDNNMNWSTKQTVKSGDTSVNILYPPAYAPQDERWGDYTGICRNYIPGSLPEVWLAGGYGANTPPRPNSWATWIAQIKSGGFTVISSPVNEDKAQGKIYPNPTQELFYLDFENEEDGEVSVVLYDMSGRMIKTLFKDQLRKSKNHLSFNKLMLANGNYVVNVKRNGKVILSKKLNVMK